MRYNPLDQSFYVANRKNVIGEMEEKSMAILLSADEYPRCGDTTFPFRQNSDLLYLCGINQEETVLTLSPWHPNPDYREILFVKNPAPEMITWHGHCLAKEMAAAISGVKTVLFIEEFESVFHNLALNANAIYVPLMENPRLKVTFPTRENRFVTQLQKEYPAHTLKRLAPILYPLRVIKQAKELNALKKACEITEKAFMRAVKAVKPGKYEYEIEAELIYEMLRNGATGHSFAPIIASGKDSCILHYIKNDKQMQAGDLLLMDFGAEYANYAGDCSRTVPVSGQFTPRQKSVYEAVLSICKDTIPLFKPGMTIHKINDFVFKRMDEELIKLGLYTTEDVRKQNPDKPLFKQYYMHNTSHFIGLDVHDVGERDWLFQSGMVLSCEPGIYIAREGIGVRIETDVVVGDTPIDLMSELAVEADDIEQMVGRQ
ncbi:MAG: aminopeptidase P N-terminal domain-containing protein [Bacteroidales bacterium]|jgi:Xaa-Pro aminopeptidase|nr:aminopeptidase P N-terminal domain-containing protein [Bacteroidales bacterium]